MYFKGRKEESVSSSAFSVYWKTVLRITSCASRCVLEQVVGKAG